MNSSEVNPGFNRLYSVLPTHQYQLHSSSSERRQDAEAAVRSIFAKAYGADIHEFAPLLLCAELHGQIDTVIGLRNAAQSKLFSEQYLEYPIEQVIYQQSRVDINRRSLVELSNLVALRCGASRQLFITLAFALEQAKVQWACFTATEQVKQLLHKLSLRPIELGKASAHAVVNGASSWGGYYAQAPAVCFGNVYQAVKQLRQSPVVAAIYPQIEQQVTQLAEQIKQGFGYEH